MRVVLDANLLVSAVISTAGPPREIVNAWVDERFELVASPTLLEELRDVLDRPRFRRWVSTETAAEFIDGLAQDAEVIDEPPPPPRRTPPPPSPAVNLRGGGGGVLAPGGPRGACATGGERGA